MEKHYHKRVYRCICREKDHSVVIYKDKEKIFDVSYLDYEDARYFRAKLAPIVDLLNYQHDIICENNVIESGINLNQVFTLIDAKVKEVTPFDKGLCRRVLEELKMEIRGDVF